MDWLNNRKVLAGAAGILVAGFCFGFLAAKATEGGKTRAPAGEGVAVVESLSNLFGKPRDKNAPRAGLPKPDGFAVWRHRVDTSGASAAACIEFSRPLDPDKSYGDYVLVNPEPDQAIAVTARDSELCIRGLGFIDRRVTLLKGLPGRGKDVLAANADIDFTFGEKPPYVGFAGEGVILPREEADGVAIETVNVSALAVEVWRVPDRNLVRRSLSAPAPTAEGEYDYSWGEDSPNGEGRVIWKGDVPVRGAAGQRVTTVFPLGSVLKELRAGAYVVKVRDASGGRGNQDQEQTSPAQARRWILFTDMALATYSGSQGLDVTVRSLKSARPMGGVRVALVATNGETLAEGKTSNEG
ncbi:MAG: alpha-2-macroglobulin family protein, partial [Asticcacaulis sp.]